MDNNRLVGQISRADLVLNPNLQGVITSEGGNWKQFPSFETCSSCHDNTVFNEEMLTAKPDSKKHGMFAAENDAMFPVENCVILSDSALYIASSRSTRENAWREPEPFTETSHVEPSNRHLCLS
jgi:hypothetical protein